MAGSWEDFFIAQVGAAAALAGLVFVALSINLRQIVSSPLLVGRAAEAMLLLVTPVLLGFAVLAPAGELWIAGILAAAIAVPIWASVTRLVVRGLGPSRERPPVERYLRLVASQVALVPALVGAALLLADVHAGYGFLAASAALSIAAGVFDAWVLLVEILR